MDIKIKSEPIDIESIDEIDPNTAIKKEKELIIESDWSPKKFDDEENEYYQEFVETCNQNMFHERFVKNESICEQFTVEYIDESEYYGEDDYMNDDYYENCDNESDYYDNYENDGEEFEIYGSGMKTDSDEEAMGKEDSSESKALDQIELTKWIADNYIYRECPVCSERVTKYQDFQTHIMLNHKDSVEESESNYNFSSDGRGICKKCNQEFVSQFSRYIHSVKHSEDAGKLINICKICNFTSKRFFIQKHIQEKHSEVLKELNIAVSLRNIKCPLCSNTYTRRNQLWYHFSDKHPQECKAKLEYNCHLCKNVHFNEEDHFLQHLIEKHEMNSWKVFDYRKIFDDKDYIACKKCNKLFFQNDIYKLLRHFLTHDINFYWSCKFCCKKINFRNSFISHMCAEMVRYFEKHYSKAIVDKIHKNPEKTEWKIKNLQEFEEHIAHVCPFCNKDFSKMLKWQHHLRRDHEINTLKGLEMKVIANDSNKLSCVICHTVVANYPEQLHAHRFQHLPYKPYKCLLCSITLGTFKLAVNHVSKCCSNEDKSIFVEKNNGPYYDTRSFTEIQCSLCNNRKFHNSESAFEHYKDEHNHFEEFFTKNSDESMTCKVCQKQYVQHEKKFCFEHVHHHFDEKTFKCKLCLLSYLSFKGVNQHLLNLHYAKPLNKQSIEKNTSKTLNSEDIIPDVRQLPQLAKSSIKSYVLNEFSEFISYACPECNEGMTNQQNWHTHIRTQHNFFDESNLYIKDADGSFKCPTCNITIDIRILQQQKHKLTHMPYRSFMCNLCYVRCNSLGVLYGHFRRKHFAKGKFECPICVEVLQTEYQRTEHLKKTHPRKEWPANMCLICYRIMSCKTTLVKHMVIHNADRLRYTCDVCGSKVVALRDFNSHMDRHKIKGEINEKIDDGNISPSASKSSQSNDTEDIAIVPESDDKHLKKRKSPNPSLTSLTKKRKKK